MMKRAIAIQLGSGLETGDLLCKGHSTTRAILNLAYDSRVLQNCLREHFQLDCRPGWRHKSRTLSPKTHSHRARNLNTMSLQSLTNLNLPKPTFLWVSIISPDSEFIGTLQKSRCW